MKIKAMSTLIIAGTVAALLNSTAAFADMTGYTQLKDSVTSQLNGLGVDTSEIGKLSTTQLGQLTSTLTGKENDDIKAASATFMISEFLHPMTATLDSPDGMKVVETLKQKLLEIGIDYPTETLTSTQVSALVAAIDSRKRPENKKQAVQAVMAMMMRGDVAPADDSGIMQMEADIYAKLTGLGLTPPPKGTLTFEQLGKLEGIISTSDTEAQMKAAAAVVLNPS